MAAQNKVPVAVNGYGVIAKRIAHAVTLQEDMTLINSVKELTLDIGRARADPYEVALWEAMLTVRGDGAVLCLHG